MHSIFKLSQMVLITMCIIIKLILLNFAMRHCKGNIYHAIKNAILQYKTETLLYIILNVLIFYDYHNKFLTIYFTTIQLSHVSCNYNAFIYVYSVTLIIECKLIKLRKVRILKENLRT